MKKALTLVMVLAVLITSLVIMPSAAAGQVEWDTYASAGAYDEDAEKDPVYPGYRYTSDGIQMYTGDLASMQAKAFGTIQTKTAVDFTKGVTMTVSVESFDDSNVDKWINIFMWNKQKIAPGEAKYGEGWGCLIRPSAAGLDIQSYVCDGSNALGSFSPTSASVNIYNGESLTFEVKKEDGAYAVYICGVKCASSTAGFDTFFPDGEAYFGVCAQSGSYHEMLMTITEFNGVKPAGTDSKAPYAPSETVIVGTPENTPKVEEGKPCCIWDPVEDFKTGKGSGFTGTLNADDGSAHITFDSNPPMIHFSCDIEYWYNTTEFPVFAILFKNLDNIGGGASLWYCGADVIAAQNDSVTSLSWMDADGDFTDENGWRIITIDLTDMNRWDEGRINAFRLDIAGDGSLEGETADIKWAGFFRSEKDAYYYGGLNAVYDAYSSQTDAPIVTDAPETNAPETNAPETNAPGTDSNNTNPANTTDGKADPAEESNLTWLWIVIGVVAVAVIVVVVIVVSKKKK